MKELIIEADRSRLDEVLAFVGRHLEHAGCGGEARMQVELAVEEIFVNIARYAYHPETGQAMVRCVIREKPSTLEVEFTDSGTPYNPLQAKAPILHGAPEDRPIGGLGVHLTRRLMDGMEYRFAQGKNILTLKKRLEKGDPPSD